MIEEDKWFMVNNAETTEELRRAIGEIGADTREGIQSNRQPRIFEVNRQIANVPLVVDQNYPARILTRAYGIRQQALYIRYYEQLEKEAQAYGNNSASTDPDIHTNDSSNL